MAAHPLDSLFHPRAIAIVGVSASEGARRSAFLGGLLDQQYQERHPLYLVHPRASEIQGVRCYPTVLDCLGPVDHVISSIPRVGVDALVEQCIAKGVRSLHLFTAGFSEAGDAESADAERAVIAKARASGIRVIGPNCLGLYVPSERIAFAPNQPKEIGTVFGLSQSGVNAIEMLQLAERGPRFSKLVSFGNGADIDAAQLLDYAAEDPDSVLVVAYLEGAGRGRELFAALKRCAAVKPVIVLKGGITATGARAAQSHTGSLAGSGAVFEALCRQTGAMLVDDMEELHDLAVAVSSGLRHVQGGRGILLGIGGGFSVLSADSIARQGLDLPELSEATRTALREYIPVAGNSTRNPIDATFLGGERLEIPEQVIALCARAPGFDLLFTSAEGPPPPDAAGGRPEERAEDRRPGAPDPDAEARAMARAERARSAAVYFGALQAESGRPLAVIRRGRDPVSTRIFFEQAYQHGVAAFPTVLRAARVVARLLRWRASREGLPPLF